MSRKIDVLIAEHVMGWTKEPTQYDGEYLWTSPDEAITIMPDGIEKYSTDIAAAFEVVGKMPYNIDLKRFDETKQWKCLFVSDPIKGAIENTPAMAICLAALKVKRIQTGQQPDKE